MEEAPLPPDHPLRPRSLVYAVLGFTALVVLAASDVHVPLAVAWGVAAALLATWGLLDFMGCFDDDRTANDHTLSLVALRAPLGQLAAATLLWLAALRLAVAGVLPGHAWLAPLLVTVTSLGGVVVLARLARRLDSLAGCARSPWQRPGVWLVLLGTALYVPWLGSYSLLDPWETHYGEVAREMLARNDWLSLWWAQDGWFWSKPALTFWIQGLFFSLLGVRFEPDALLAAAARGHLPQPEWAARMPVVLLSLTAVYLLYRFVARAAGKRAGFLAGLALTCMPYWALLSHQSMTDMPYVAPVTGALALFGLALLTNPDQQVGSLRISAFGRRLSVSGFHLLFGLVLLSSLPQLAYLLSRNVTLQLAAPPYGFRWHLDELFAGSGLGNCGLPGNQGCREAQPANAMFQPALGALVFGSALLGLLRLNRGERRLKRLLYLAAWYCTALAALAKGAPGLVLPLAVIGAVLCVRRQWQELTRVELAGLGLLLACTTLPWYVQEYMRHGEPFTDRLLFHDMYKRAFVHVHDTNAGSDVSLGYYAWQLGYGVFPWTGLAALGVGLGLKQASSDDAGLRELAVVSSLWLMLGFGLFTLSLTKFHHYALPCAPPLAVGVGLLLDRAWGTRAPERPRGQLTQLAAALAGTLLLVYGTLRLRPGSPWGDVLGDGTLPAASPLLGGVCIALGSALAALSIYAGRATPPTTEPDPSFAPLALAAALLVLLVTRDLSTSLAGDVPGSARLLHLFSYNYKRAWPASLDFEATLWAFGLLAAAALALSSVGRWRRPLVLLSCALGAWFCAFSLWIYLPRLAPHYGQRELLLAYYRARQGPNEPIIAYQMNWKGENFYSGNRLPAFVSSGAKFQSWLEKQRKSGTQVAFFVTEHGRVGTLKSELGKGVRLRSLTDKRASDKFTLVRVELGPPAGEP